MKHPLHLQLSYKFSNYTYHIVRLRLSNQDQDVGADYRQAEVEQDDGSFRANVSERERLMRTESGVIRHHVVEESHLPP